MTKSVIRTHCPEIQSILLLNGQFVELANNQSWYKTERCYEIWWDGPDPLPHRVAFFRRSSTVFISIYDANTLPIPTEPTARFLYRRLKEAEDLLREALHGVDADEQDRALSWPDEIERGELTLDLGDRIRAYLSEENDG